MATKTKQKEVVVSKPMYHTQLVEAFNNAEGSKFDMAVAIYNCYTCVEQSGLTAWQEMGYKTFKEYVENEFGLEYRNAMYYVSIGEFVQFHGIQKELFEDVGWSKIKLILPEMVKSKMSGSEIDKTLKSIKKMTVNELRLLLKNKDKKDTSQNETVKKTFTFTIDQYEVIRTALDTIKERKNIDSDSYALEILCNLYLSSQDLFEE